MTKAQVASDEKPFDLAREELERLAGDLLSADAAKMSHNEAEEFVADRGQEVLRLMLQAYFDNRSLNEVESTVVGADGVHRTHRRVRSVPIMSVVGEVAVARQTYGQRGTKSLAPLDAALNLPKQKYSHGVIKRVAEEAAKGSYDDAVDTVSKLGGIRVPKRQAEEIAIASAVDFDEFYGSERDEELPLGPAVADDSLLVLTTDGKGIVMRPESLRAETAMASATAVPRLNGRLSKGEKTNRKRMALVAAVYSLAPWRRTPEDFIRELRPVSDTAVVRPRPVQKRVWASIEKPAESVISNVFDEGLRRDPELTKTWVCLIDGNVSQLSNMRATADKHDIKLTIIIDIIHVIEYLWKAAWCFFEEGDRSVETWVNTRILEVLRGNCSQVAAGIRRTATNRQLTNAQRSGADKCANYLLKYKEYLKYDQFLAAGMPIATGVIEGACRYLVKDRMDITGARWSLKGAEAVLRLRALRASGDLADYWQFHQSRELSRNHLENYAEAQIPAIERRAPSLIRKPNLRLVK